MKVKVKYEGVLVAVVVVVVLVVVVLVVVGGVEAQLRSFLTSALDCGERLTSHPGNVKAKKEPRCPLNRRLGGLQRC